MSGQVKKLATDLVMSSVLIWYFSDFVREDGKLSGQVQKVPTDLEHTVKYILISILICYFSDLVQEDKDKLSGQVQKLATDLDHCREQIAHKNKENLKVSDLCLILLCRIEYRGLS